MKQVEKHHSGATQLYKLTISKELTRKCIHLLEQLQRQYKCHYSKTDGFSQNFYEVDYTLYKNMYLWSSYHSTMNFKVIIVMLCLVMGVSLGLTVHYAQL
jgi:ABC-type proline/glycine betaine transport system permease subunit